jgi:hypothetical protein
LLPALLVGTRVLAPDRLKALPFLAYVLLAPAVAASIDSAQPGDVVADVLLVSAYLGG